MTGLRIRIRGRVQGVGFRPFVWQLAQRFGISGTVANDAQGVLIHARGGDLDGFLTALRREAPPLAQIDDLETQAWPGRAMGFSIAGSGPAGSDTGITPDAATCRDCLQETRDDGRRRGYAFTNCTHCGPRFTILNGLPYDRARTAMANFAMCDACRAEYEDPADRRFHAQPIACPDCGPRLWYEDAQGTTTDTPLTRAAARLLAGGIVAVKGLGGFHLACDATSADAISRLRDRKRRPDKPLAVMGDRSMLTRHALAGPDHIARMENPAAPVVLVPKRGTLPDALAPGLTELGWMLPYTPLHHLLVDIVMRPLVMTSGNLSGEPQVIGNDEARQTLAGFVDGFLMHDRDIVRRLDDSVERADPPMILRRARGRVPGTLPLPSGFEDTPPGIAYGGQMKGALCLIKSGRALLGHHLGDLDDAKSVDAFHQAEADYRALFNLSPAWVACDLHPEFHASRHARGQGVPVHEIQHHHAHLAACLGENLWPLNGGRVAGIVLDGLGLGPDGTVWGGEVLLGDYHGFSRHSWLVPAPLPGGDAAQRDPWRNLLARLDRAGLPDLADRLLPRQPLAMLRRAIAAGVNAPLSSSVGRLFDAASAAILAQHTRSYEGAAAMRLEAAARAAASDQASRGYTLGSDAAGGPLEDCGLWSELAADLEAGTDAATMALRFHTGVATGFARQARALVDSGAARAVALSGGCFQNAVLLTLTLQALDGVPVMTHRTTPANDGGLALGQALVAAARQVVSA